MNDKSQLLPHISMHERDYIINQFLEKTYENFKKENCEKENLSVDNNSNHIQFMLKLKNVTSEVYFAFAWFDTTNPKNWKNFGIRLIGDISKEDREKIQNEIIKEIDNKFNGYTLSNYIIFNENSNTKTIKDFICNNIHILNEANRILEKIKI